MRPSRSQNLSLRRSLLASSRAGALLRATRGAALEIGEQSKVAQRERVGVSLRSEFRPDADGTLEFVFGFEDFEAEVGVGVGGGEVVVDDVEGGLRLLAVDEGVEPGDEEEDFAVALDLREGFEGGVDIRGGEAGLVPIIEGAE